MGRPTSSAGGGEVKTRLRACLDWDLWKRSRTRNMFVIG